MNLDHDRVIRHKLRNLVRAGLLLLGLSLLLGLLGWILGGWGGVLSALVVAAMVMLVGPRVQPRLLLSRSGARRLPRSAAPEIYELLDALYRRAGIEAPPSLWYVPSTALNAFAVGSRRNGAIAVTAGLLHALPMRALAGVLAHEVSHLRHNDTWVMSLASLITDLTTWLAFLGQVLVLALLPQAIQGDLELSWLALLALVVAPTVSTVLQLMLSRNQELTADLEAARLTGDPEGLAQALARLERANGTWLEAIFLPRGQRLPVPGWLRTHPETRERIARLLALRPESGQALPVTREPLPRSRAHDSLRMPPGFGPRRRRVRVFRL